MHLISKRTLVWVVLAIVLLLLTFVGFVLYLEWCLGPGPCRA